MAIGELAEGLEIDLNKVPKKYEGLDGTELAISESQERMAVVVEEKDAARFMSWLTRKIWRPPGGGCHRQGPPHHDLEWKKIVDIARAFLDTNGVEKHITAVTAPAGVHSEGAGYSVPAGLPGPGRDLNVCSKRDWQNV